ncbi:restriction endonuclease subunit S [Photobacterium phosphoreum]|uniref:restriction endonuclease subunit S n=1 Tax=Photobacterium phosphoreum TaxID=659 RepID=UPI0007F8FA42|nr:restriction endonuclease subunit S [Photobacterium phosphoreum]OBU36736.1 type I restriction endonuclease subunit S [Photobacterium phosphoreum]PSW33827.1 restriction endonuclease subunit S [Photobacterium phosphoreum]
MSKAALSGKYAAYPEYKDSGVEWVGSIPSSWEMWKLSHAYELIGSGTTPTSNNEKWFQGDIPWITTGELRENIITDTTKKVSPLTIETFTALKIYPKGSIAIAMYGATIGRLGILGVDATTNQACCVMTKSKVLKNKYLFYWLQAFKDDIVQLSSGGGQPNINQEKVAALKISAPVLKEQTQIAAFLDHETAKVDTLIEKQQQLIELLKEKRQAVISHAVTKGLNPDVPMKDSGVEWLSEVPEHWDLPKLIHITKNIGDGLHSTPKYQDNTGYYFVNGNNLVNGQILIGSTAKEVPESEYDTHYVHLDSSTVLLSINGTIGNVAKYNNEQIILGKSAAYMNCTDTISPDYLMLLLKTSEYRRYFDLEVTGTTISNLSLNSIRQMKTCTPPLVEQTEIVEYCHLNECKYNNLIESAQKAINLMQERRTALISAAVTGKIDVRHFTLEDGVALTTNSDTNEAAQEATV